MTYIAFLRENAPFLLAGALLAFLSAFGQTFFISIFAGEIRAEFGLSDGDWGLIYMIGTGASAALMIWAGGLADVFRVRVLGIAVVLALACACLAMSFASSTVALALVIFALRFTGQGMSHHVAMVAMSRWFVANRGRAIAIAGLGFMLGEAVLPLLMVWLKSMIAWRSLWVGFAVFCLIICPILYALLRQERTPQGDAQIVQTAGMHGRHWTRREALMHPLFWLMSPAIICFSAFGTVFWFQQVQFAEIKGIPHLSLVAVFPLGTAALALSSLAYGWLIDRFGASRVLPFYIFPYVAAFAVHGMLTGLGWVAVGVILMGIAGGGHGTLLTACWAEFYGTNNLGKIKSAATALMVLGSALGPGLSGWLLDINVGLETQMLGYSASFAFAAVLLFFARRTHVSASA